MDTNTTGIETVMRNSRDVFELSAPIEARPPVLAEVLQEATIESIFPLRTWDLVRPASSAQPVVQIIQRGLGEGNDERFHSHLESLSQADAAIKLKWPNLKQERSSPRRWHAARRPSFAPVPEHKRVRLVDHDNGLGHFDQDLLLFSLWRIAPELYLDVIRRAIFLPPKICRSA